MTTKTGVLQAAAHLVDAFAREDLDAYFGCFTKDATYLFYTVDHLLTSVEEYRSTWQDWVREDGFRVLDATSSDQRVRVVGTMAIFTHTVRTTVETSAGQSTLHEFETIVFQVADDGRWLAVHEHLSPAPSAVRHTS